MGKFCLTILIYLVILCISFIFSPVKAENQPGDQATDFTLLSQFGLDLSLYDYWGDIIVLNLFTEW